MRVLLLNQAFYPDVASSGQHASDLARALAGQGHQVTALASRRAYDNPRVRFAQHESWNDIEIIRVPCSGFGKSTKWRRAADFVSFYARCLERLAWMPRFDVIVAMTTPPLISFMAALFGRLKGGALYLWTMDLNPDQAVAAGWLKERSAATKVLEACLRYSLRQAKQVVVLDRFMRERVLSKGAAEEKVTVVAPWAHDRAVRYDPEGRGQFRRAHGLEGKFVVMYSGNHSPCHPLDTLLEAARLGSFTAEVQRPHREIVFCFVGGGSEFAKVASCGLRNVVCLPYQPLDRLSASLSAADLHVVVMGDPFVGIVHPCKMYNVLRLGIPLLYIGPPESHITDMLPPEAVGDWAHVFRHGDVQGVARCIRECASLGPRRFEHEMRLAERFSEKELVPRFLNLLEDTEHRRGAQHAEVTACARG